MNAARRNFLQAIAGGAALATVGCARSHLPMTCDQIGDEMERLRDFDGEVLTIGMVSRPAIVLLHELPGLYDATLGLGRCLAKQEFSVYLPLLFGTVGQDNSLLGYFQACWSREFACGRLQTTSKAVKKVSVLCDEAANRSGQKVGVIGMCLTGAFPLALLGTNPNVTAAVMCQPALPFSALKGRPTDAEAEDLGVSQKNEESARGSGIPFLALRYLDDRISPERRMMVLEERFKNQVATIRLPSGHPSTHSTLAGNFNQAAFDDTVAYLRVRMGLGAGPKDMKLARLDGAPCRIGGDGRWAPRA
jgi:dienelactone hydrolase